VRACPDTGAAPKVFAGGNPVDKSMVKSEVAGRADLTAA
jgi:hypothetical protein